MAEGPPSIYLLYGDDRPALEEALRDLLTKVGDAGAQALNVTRVSAASLDLESLARDAMALPLLGGRRVIVIEEAAHLPTEGQRRQQLVALLDSLPPTTALVFLAPIAFEKPRDRDQWEASWPPLAWAREHRDRAFAKRFDLPTGPGFVRWLRQRAAREGGELEPQAAALLAELVAGNPLLAQQELDKLLAYTDRCRPIEAADVERLTPYYGQSDVFAMVDALGARDGRRALARLQHLLRQEDPGYAFAMIARQVRLLIMARQALNLGQDPRERLKVHPFVAEKIAAQARNFRLEQLQALHRRLLEIDLAVKTGKADLQTELDRLVAAFAV